MLADDRQNSVHLEIRRAMAERFVATLLHHWGDNLVSAVLFGSVARGEAGPTSDIDLLIVARELPKGRFARMDLLAPAMDACEPAREEILREGNYTDFTALIYTEQQAARTRPIYLDMVEDAVMLFDRDGYMAGVLDRLRRRMRELGSRRVRMGRIRYWELKPDRKPGEVISL